MIAIRPLTITDAMLNSSNVPDVDDIGTSSTSLLIAIASKTFTTQAGLPFLAGEWVKAYSTATPTNYMYGKITSYTGTTLIVNMTVNGGAGTLADWKISYGWNVSAAYLDGDRVQISTPNIHKIYEALENVTGGTAPNLDVLLAVPKWLEVSSTNRWKMFDLVFGSQTTNADTITVVLTPGERVDSIVFLNLDASRITIVVNDLIDGEVYNKTIYLEATELVVWGTDEQWGTDEAWEGGAYTELIEKVGLKTDLPPYSNPTITVTIIGSSDTTKCGTLIIGRYKTLGITSWSPSVGIIDYSTKEADTFGNYSIVIRAHSKRISCVFVMNTTYHVEVLRFLTEYRAKPLVWILSDDYNTTIAYGFYKEFTINLGHILSDCSMTLEGLT